MFSKGVGDDGCSVDGGGGGGDDDDRSLCRIVKSLAHHVHVGGISRVMPEGLAVQVGGGRGV